ncbi:SHOCT domain-containing protein [Acidocella sp.]|uniref:SHOCT domain-containing protein n=1 Tax=Acidocella sp. TaxID=50710 RepID=UPI00262E26FF|nr:SHOCT domain-containing protein [Acidocella sp.]
MTAKKHRHLGQINASKREMWNATLASAYARQQAAKETTMNKLLGTSVGTALALSLAAAKAWADTPAGSPAAGYQGPGWSGYGPGPRMMGGWAGGPMMGYGGWGGFNGGGLLMMIFGAIVVVALLVFIFRTMAWPSHALHHPTPSNRAASAGLDALDARYARGEINREEYLQKKRDILQQS